MLTIGLIRFTRLRIVCPLGDERLQRDGSNRSVLSICNRQRVCRRAVSGDVCENPVDVVDLFPSLERPGVSQCRLNVVGSVFASCRLKIDRWASDRSICLRPNRFSRRVFGSWFMRGFDEWTCLSSHCGFLQGDWQRRFFACIETGRIGGNDCEEQRD